MSLSTSPTHPRPAILVVDDDPAVREALSAALGHQYVVHTAGCGADAVTVLRAHRIAVIILDAILRDEHGLDYVSRFRAAQPAPILLLTGHGSEALAARALRVKVDDYQNKPVSLPALRAAVDRLVAPTTPPQDLTARVRQRLETYPPKPLDLAALAHEVGVSEGYLRRLFRTTHGRTPRRYLLEYRLRQAATRLRKTADRIEAIAADGGFPSSTRFGRAFAAVYGRTPSEYRARARSGSS
jgi:AraC-like DNA-binding protein